MNKYFFLATLLFSTYVSCTPQRDLDQANLNLLSQANVKKALDQIKSNLNKCLENRNNGFDADKCHQLYSKELDDLSQAINNQADDITNKIIDIGLLGAILIFMSYKIS
jgi:hypothetical protein